jgi:cyclin-dependent kinase 2
MRKSVQFCLDTYRVILSFLPPLSDEGASLSHRRNKGLLLAVGDRISVRKLNLVFFNSGVNDGLPSSVIRESVILRGKLGTHPNIVPLLELGAPSVNTVRMVYPFIPSNLREFCSSSQWNPTMIREVAHQIFRGLSFAHSHRVIHRNIRPENILVSVHDGSVLTVKIGDWTQSRTLGIQRDVRCPLTPEESKNRVQTSKERCRLRYRAPELLLRIRDYDFAVDMWSVGVVLLELFLDGQLPWNQACSESEILFHIFSSVGTPDPAEWPEGMLSLQLLCGSPSFPSPDIQAISRKPNFVLTDSNSVWEKIKINHGPQALLLVGKLLQPIPSKRPQASVCHFSPFVLGEPNSRSLEWLCSSEPFASLCSLPDDPRKERDYPRLEYIGYWLFKLARLVDCQSSKPVHVAALLFESVMDHVSNESNMFALLAACFKIAIRFHVSKDMFKQVICSDIVSACNYSICQEAILEAERFMLNRIDSLVDCFGSTVIDHIEHLLSGTDRRLLFVSQYVADITLLSPRFTNLHMRPSEQALACGLIASQWLDISFPKTIEATNVDSLQIAVNVGFQALTETTSVIAAREEGVLEKILLGFYRGAVPRTKCSNRISVDTMLGGSSRRFSSSSSASGLNATPPKPLLLRRSTIEHAEQWAIESRRKKRSRSLTPMRMPKRMRVNDENNFNIPNVCLTPRRSERLVNRKLSSINKT